MMPLKCERAGCTRISIATGKWCDIHTCATPGCLQFCDDLTMFCAEHAPQTVPMMLRAGAATYEERNKLYGDNYKKFGAFMIALFPDGPPSLRTVADWNRMGIFVQVVAKMTRYAESFPRGGHADSAHDLMVYAAMLEELTEVQLMKGKT